MESIEVLGIGFRSYDHVFYACSYIFCFVASICSRQTSFWFLLAGSHTAAFIQAIYFTNWGTTEHPIWSIDCIKANGCLMILYWTLTLCGYSRDKNRPAPNENK